MNWLLKKILSKNSLMIIAALVGYFFVASYKFRVIYLLLAPFATILNWLIFKDNSEEYKKNLIEYKASVPLTIRIVAISLVFLYSSMFWINCILRDTRSDLFPEEVKENV